MNAIDKELKLLKGNPQFNWTNVQLGVDELEQIQMALIEQEERDSGLDENIDVSVTLYFEVKNSEMYGGAGSVGYSCFTFEGVENIQALYADDFVEKQIDIQAELLKVSPENVSVICKDEYETATADDGEEDDKTVFLTKAEAQAALDRMEEQK